MYHTFRHTPRMYPIHTTHIHTPYICTIHICTPYTRTIYTIHMYTQPYVSGTCVYICVHPHTHPTHVPQMGIHIHTPYTHTHTRVPRIHTPQIVTNIHTHTQYVSHIYVHNIHQTHMCTHHIHIHRTYVYTPYLHTPYVPGICIHDTHVHQDSRTGPTPVHVESLQTRPVPNFTYTLGSRDHPLHPSRSLRASTSVSTPVGPLVLRSTILYWVSLRYPFPHDRRGKSLDTPDPGDRSSRRDRPSTRHVRRRLVTGVRK